MREDYLFDNASLQSCRFNENKSHAAQRIHIYLDQPTEENKYRAPLLANMRLSRQMAQYLICINSWNRKCNSIFFFLLGIFNKINIFLHRYYITQFQFILLQKDLELPFSHFESSYKSFNRFKLFDTSRRVLSRRIPRKMRENLYYSIDWK